MHISLLFIAIAFYQLSSGAVRKNNLANISHSPELVDSTYSHMHNKPIESPPSVYIINMAHQPPELTAWGACQKTLHTLH